MARLLALEWNDSEARLAVATRRGDRVVFEQAFSVALRGGPAEPPQPEVDVGGRIAAAMAARGVGRLDTLVAIGRSSIELRQLSVPPGPDEELPLLVRFQAMREFNALDEDWLLDFVPIDDEPGEPRTVLAAAIGPELVGQTESTCRTAGLKPERLILRPCAAASLLCRARAAARMQVRLLVDLLDDEADLTVMIDRKVIFLRTARLPGDPLTDPEAAGALLAEIRRTMAAVQNRLEGRRVACIVLCGTGPEHAALAQRLQDELTIPADLFDPFEGLSLGSELQRALPDHPGRFAPLLGMLLDEMEQVAPAVDFLHPRRSPEPPSPRKKYFLAGGIAALLLVLFLGYRFWCRIDLASDIKKKTEELGQLDKELLILEKKAKAVAEIEKWMTTDVVWLDEFRRMADLLPPAKDVALTHVSAGPDLTGGEIRFAGLARNATTIDQLEAGLRDKAHRVRGQGRSGDSSKKGYTFEFRSSLLVPPEKP